MGAEREQFLRSLSTWLVNAALAGVLLALGTLYWSVLPKWGGMYRDLEVHIPLLVKLVTLFSVTGHRIPGLLLIAGLAVAAVLTFNRTRMTEYRQTVYLAALTAAALLLVALALGGVWLSMTFSLGQAATPK